jgi:hypothetical protein
MNYVYVQLRGGLGNQLFQYAAARSIAIAQNADLVLDTRTGFALDRVYKRKFALGGLSISGQTANLFYIFTFLFLSLITRSERVAYSRKVKIFLGELVYEKTPKFHDYLITQGVNRNLLLIGYWQSPKYFENHRFLLTRELMPPCPTENHHVMKLAEHIRICDSVAVGIRLYEESSNPADHALSGEITSIEKINKQVQQMRRDRPNAKFFVFCTYNARELHAIDFPEDTHFVTGSNGFSNPMESLWLLSRCKHHIFNNSSFYWWGAWLSHSVHDAKEQLVYASNNFINTDGLCDHWNRF